jgi:hypothetical protein
MDCEFTKSCEESIRRSPLAAMGVAAAAGIVLTKLPVFSLLRPALGLVRPALLILGGWKAVEMIQKSCDEKSQNGTSNISEAIS